jgi:hypothetical protein
VSNPYRDKLLSVGYLSKGRTRPRVKEYRTEESGIVKVTRDELGNDVTQHSKGDRQDVHIRNYESVTAATSQNGA